MAVLQRRRILAMGVAALVMGLGTGRGFSASDFRTEGCCLLNQKSGQKKDRVPPEERTLESSGDKNVDLMLGRALVHLSSAFEVYPDFRFYDDRDGLNALAAPFSLTHGTNGTVLFGVRLFHRQIDAHPDGDIAVLGICAHEFGHIVQYFSPYYKELRKAHRTVKLVELHADFLAGYFVALRRERFPDIKLQGLGEAWEAMGDVQYNAPGHHGTAAERLQAIERGYFFGRDESGDVRSAAKLGAQYVRQNFS